MADFERDEFIEYCWDFYGPGKMCGAVFMETLTREELISAVDARLANGQFEGDTFDREWVRDHILIRRTREKLNQQEPGE